MSDAQRTVRSVFGKEMEVPDMDGAAIRELMEISTDLLKVEGDPNFEYAWLVANDPLTSVKIRKGLWEMVDGRDESVIAPGSVREKDGAIRVNELVLVRMPKELYQKLRKAETAVALQREAGVVQGYKSQVEQVARKISPDMTADPTISQKEEVKVGSNLWGRR